MTLDGNGALDLDVPATRLTVYTGLSIEARAVRTALPDADVRVTGMGARRPARLRSARQSRRQAAAPAQPAVGATPAPVAVVGFCGALDRGLSSGDVVVATEVRGPDGVVRCPSAPFLVAGLRALGIDAQAGPIVTTDHIVHGAERDRLRDTGAIAVDMESAAVAGAAAGAPFAVLRVVSDTPARGLARPSLLTDGLRGLRTLRRVSAVLTTWAAAAGEREALLAGPRSFCAGVERAIEIVERALERYGAPVYVRKQIVHNAHVVQRLERMGAVFVDELDDVPDGATTVFSAHGVSPQVRDEAGRRHLDVIDATCPLVSKVHAEARRFADRGDTVVLIGHAGHEEVEGTLGQAPGRTVLVGDADDVATIDLPDPKRVSYVMQTTLAVDEAAGVVDALRERFPALAGPNSDDICYATSNRQDAVRAIAANADIVLVVGSANSSNSQRLVEISQRMGVPAHLVDDASYVEPAWLAGRRNVGITAGASAPQDLVDQLVEALRGLGPVTVTERTVANETLSFTLPKEVS